MMPLDSAEDCLYGGLSGVTDVFKNAEEQKRPVVDVLGSSQRRYGAIALRISGAQRWNQRGSELHEPVLGNPHPVCREVLVAGWELRLEACQGGAEVVVLQDRCVSHSGNVERAQVAGLDRRR